MENRFIDNGYAACCKQSLAPKWKDQDSSKKFKNEPGEMS